MAGHRRSACGGGRRVEPLKRAARVKPGRAAVLVVIGVHREELAFGREVVGGLQAGEVDVLEIPEGLPGRRPRPDQCFWYDVGHEALYLQLLPHVGAQHRLLIDLHAGLDENAPCADLICGDAAFGERLRARLAADPADVRVIVLDSAEAVQARTVIPVRIRNNPDFLYVCMEVYLAEAASPQAGWRFL